METTIETTNYVYTASPRYPWLQARHKPNTNCIPVARITSPTTIARYDRTWSGETMEQAITAFIRDFEDNDPSRA